MAGERGLHGNRRGLFVADLADHDLVGIVAEDCAQAACERQPLLLVDGNLSDAAELVLDRILDRDDLVLRRLNLGERGIERRRLAGAGGAGDEHHAVRLLDELAELQQHVFVEAEDVEPQILELGVHRLLVENTDDGVFAVRGGDDRDAEVDRASRDPQLEAAVLGDALLGDVELGHDLDTADDRRVMAFVDRLERFVEHAVDAVLDDDFVVARFDVNVRCAALDRVEDDRVDELDDRRRFLLRDRVDRQRLFAFFILADELHAEAFRGFVEDALGRFRLLQLVSNGSRRGDLHLERSAEKELELVETKDVGRIADDDVNVAVLAALGQELITDHQLQWNIVEQLMVDLEVLQVDEGEAVLLRDALRARGFTVHIGILQKGARITGHSV